MAGVNKVILVGNLGDDPEARSLNNGGEVVNLRVATSENWKDRDGQRQERTEWHRVVIFNENLGKVAKILSEEGLEGLSRGPDPDPQMDRPVGRRTAIRPRSCCSASAASWSCSTRGGGGGGGGFGGGDDYGDSFGGGSDFGGGRAPPAAAPGAGLFDSDLDDDVPF